MLLLSTILAVPTLEVDSRVPFLKRLVRSFTRLHCIFVIYYSDAPTSYEITLITSTHVLPRLRARFASIVCLLLSVFYKLASVISRVWWASLGSMSLSFFASFTKIVILFFCICMNRYYYIPILCQYLPRKISNWCVS